MNEEFLNKVYDQIISETMVIDDKVYTLFSSPSSLSFSFFSFLSRLPSSSVFSFYSHCRDVYCLKNDQEIEYVWTKYKEELTAIINEKELC